MKKYFYRLLPILPVYPCNDSCNDTETVISIGEARNLVAEISTQSAAIGDNVTFTCEDRSARQSVGTRRRYRRCSELLQVRM